MTWLLPTVADIPSAGEVRSVGRFDRRAYDRAYYHAKRKARRKQVYTPEQKARRRAQRAAAYVANIEHERALARARYWRNRDKYAAAARDRKRARSKTTE